MPGVNSSFDLSKTAQGACMSTIHKLPRLRPPLFSEKSCDWLKCDHETVTGVTETLKAKSICQIHLSNPS